MSCMFFLVHLCPVFPRSFFICYHINNLFYFVDAELSGSVIECLTRDQGVAGSSLIGTLSKTLYPLLSTGPDVIKLVPCSTQLSTKFILLINVKKVSNCWHFMTISEGIKARIFIICWYFSLMSS